MFKLIVLFAIAVSAVSAGVIGLGHGYAVAPVATSYQNSNSLSVHATPVVAAGHGIGLVGVRAGGLGWGGWGNGWGHGYGGWGHGGLW